jgi:hypothetical protein
MKDDFGHTFSSPIFNITRERAPLPFDGMREDANAQRFTYLFILCSDSPKEE